MSKINAFISIMGLGFLSVGSVDAKVYDLDADHTSVGFKVRHMMMSNVAGNFGKVAGKFETDDKTGNLKSLEAVKADTIATNNADRDAHLKSPDFFDVAKYPEIKFVASNLNLKKGESGKMTGNLTMHGTTKPVTFDVEFLGTIKDPKGIEHSGFSAKVEKLNRQDFGMNFSKTLDNGGLVVANDVAIEVGAEGKAHAGTDAVAEGANASKETKAKNKNSKSK